MKMKEAKVVKKQYLDRTLPQPNWLTHQKIQDG